MSPATRPTPPRCAASTRPARPSTWSSARRWPDIRPRACAQSHTRRRLIGGHSADSHRPGARAPAGRRPRCSQPPPSPSPEERGSFSPSSCCTQPGWCTASTPARAAASTSVRGAPVMVRPPAPGAPASCTTTRALPRATRAAPARDERRAASLPGEVRIFSGIQPTGRKHLGNYIGAIAPWVATQDRGEAIYCVVDLHALSVPWDPAELREGLYDLTALLLAAGLDPRRCILFRQSDVAEHTEMTWLLSSVTAWGDLNRMHQFKEKSAAQRELVSAALFF